MSGAENGIRGRVYALDAKTGNEVWRFYTVPARATSAATPGHRPTIPTRSSATPTCTAARTVWQAPAIDPELGMMYFSTGQRRPGLRRLGAPWRQPVHRLDRRARLQDRPVQVALPGSPPRHLGLRRAQPDRAVRPDVQRPDAQGHVRVRQDRLVLLPGPHQRPAADRHRREAGRAGAAPGHRGDPAVSRSATRSSTSAPSRCRASRSPGCIFTPFWDIAGLLRTAGQRRHGVEPDARTTRRPATCTSWAASRTARWPCGQMPFVLGKTLHRAARSVDRRSARRSRAPSPRWTAAPTRSSGRSATTCDQSYGAVSTAGGLVFRGKVDGNLVAYDATTGDELWRFQTGWGISAPPMTYVDRRHASTSPSPSGGNRGGVTTTRRRRGVGVLAQRHGRPGAGAAAVQTKIDLPRSAGQDRRAGRPRRRPRSTAA